jgi:hypothetical protein
LAKYFYLTVTSPRWWNRRPQVSLLPLKNFNWQLIHRQEHLVKIPRLGNEPEIPVNQVTTTGEG